MFNGLIVASVLLLDRVLFRQVIRSLLATDIHLEALGYNPLILQDILRVMSTLSASYFAETNDISLLAEVNKITTKIVPFLTSVGANPSTVGCFGMANFAMLLPTSGSYCDEA